MMEDKIKMILDNITDIQTLSVNINKYDPAEIVIVANQFYFVYDKEYSTFEEYIDGLGEEHEYLNRVYKFLKQQND